MSAERPAAYVAVRWPAARRLQHDWGHLERDKQEALYAQMREQIMASIRDALAVVGFEVVEEVEASV